MDRVPRAASFRAAAGSACHTFSDEIVSEARRVLGTFRDFTVDPEKLLLDEPEDFHS